MRWPHWITRRCGRAPHRRGRASPPQVVTPHLLDRGAVESRRRGELVLRRHRSVVEHRLVQHLEHHRRRRAVGGALRKTRGQRCAGTAPRDGQAGRCRHPAPRRWPQPSSARSSRRRARPGTDVPAPAGSRRTPPCSVRAWRTRHIGGDRCRGCRARKHRRGNRSPRVPATRRHGRCAPGSIPPRGSRIRRRRCRRRATLRRGAGSVNHARRQARSPTGRSVPMRDAAAPDRAGRRSSSSGRIHRGTHRLAAVCDSARDQPAASVGGSKRVVGRPEATGHAPERPRAARPLGDDPAVGGAKVVAAPGQPHRALPSIRRSLAMKSAIASGRTAT